MKTCTVHRCIKPLVARGYCTKHYARWQNYGDPLIQSGPAIKADGSWPECEIEGCERRSRAQRGGMCFRHYQRKRNTGSHVATRHILSNHTPGAVLADCEACGVRVPVVLRGDGTARCRASRQAQRLRYNYGVDTDVYDRLVKEQGGVCAICGRPPETRHGQERLFLDHDHVSGKIRAALCGSCNIALGMIRDNPDLADGLAAYLRAHGAVGYAAAGESTSAAGTDAVT